MVQSMTPPLLLGFLFLPFVSPPQLNGLVVNGVAWTRATLHQQCAGTSQRAPAWLGQQAHVAVRRAGTRLGLWPGALTSTWSMYDVIPIVEARPVLPHHHIPSVWNHGQV